MRRPLLICVACIVVAGCGGTPTGPTDPARGPRISRTRFLAFGDSFTAGEVTNPAASITGSISKQIVVPTASYPAVLQSHLRTTYANQASTISVANAGEPSERILDG